MPSFSVTANIVDLYARRIYFGTVQIIDGFIHTIDKEGLERKGEPYLMPGFIDAHIHIESSMLTPPAFARIAVKHGTVATVSDPHEIANVCGLDGVRYMVDLGRKSGFKFFFGAPSCVPATSFETAGAELTVGSIRTLFEEKQVHYLSEMMNYPAVLARDPLVMEKINLAHYFKLPVDGHAPGLKGEQAIQYADAGISTDHECFTLEEALDKINAGMKIIIREGSAAKNFEALHSLLHTHPEKVMLCSDDKHPDDLLHGHINQLVIRSVRLRYRLFDILRAACLQPILHYQLPVGSLRPGDPADMILVDDLSQFNVRSTWIDGEKVFDGQEVHLPTVTVPPINNFSAPVIELSDLELTLKEGMANVIVAIDGAIVTESIQLPMTQGVFESDTNRDILKIVVVNRYRNAPVAKALIKGFGLKKGAIASSVAHDSHNIVAVGTHDADLCNCINEVISHLGGVATAYGSIHSILPLPVAGLMSDLDADTVGKAYEKLDQFVKKDLGSTLAAPYMTLSFMALLVIPSLKLSDLGLFDGTAFRFTALQS
ncbi:MAG TPA: adenine deaminase [Saprospiraceae bacterium]|nr:adenine deaminase [Saprospiraceae bacterium]